MEIERNLGPQPIAALMARHGVTPHDLVAASPAQITHKMVGRAMKGRRLTANAMTKVRDALNAATGERYGVNELFDYEPA